jgi:hypothetical protein
MLDRFQALFSVVREYCGEYLRIEYSFVNLLVFCCFLSFCVVWCGFRALLVQVFGPSFA